MKATMLWGFVLALTPAMAGAQQHDMSKMAKDTAKKAPMAGMQHDMAGMKGMQGMSDSAMKGMMKNMKPGAEKTAWKELDDFHALMQATWHGAMDNDLRPAKAMSGDVVKGAEKWSKSKGPANCDNADARKGMATLSADAKAYADVVAKQGSDTDVKAALKKVHDGFEKVAMPCMMAGMKDMKGMKH